MALEYARGVIQWLAADGLSTVYTVSGLPFQPGAILFKWTGQQSATDAETLTANLRRGMGAAVSTSSRRAVGSFSQDTAATSNCGTAARNDCVACTTDGAGASDGRLDINTITSGGFTLIVDDVAPADITISWEAWGGLSVAALVDIAEPAATGTVDYTVTGFDSNTAGDQVIICAGVQSTAALNTDSAGDSGFCMGVATGSTQEHCICGNSDDASNAMDTDAYMSGDETLAMILVAGGNPDARAQFVQFGTNNFRLDWVARATTDRRYFALAMKGGKWQAGDFTVNVQTVNNTATVSGLLFQPISLDFLSSPGRSESASATSTTHDYWSYGCAKSTSDRLGMGLIDENATASSVCEIGLAIEYDAVLVGLDITTGAVSSRIDLDIINLDGFRVIVDTAVAAGSATTFVGYLASGNDRALVGTTSFAFTPASVLTGLGSLAGSAAAAFAPTSSLTGLGALVGSAPLVFSASGTLQAIGVLAGTAGMVFTPVGALTSGADNQLVGTIALQLSAAGALTGPGALIGTAPMAFAPVGALSGPGALAGATNAVFAPVGGLTGLAPLSGSAALVFSTAGVLTGPGALVGAASAIFSPIGTPTGLGALAGAAALTITPVGALSAVGVLAGSAGLVFSPTAVLTGPGALAGAAGMVFDGVGAFVLPSVTVGQRRMWQAMFS